MEMSDRKLVTQVAMKVLEVVEEGKIVPIGVSNRHVHISQEHLEILFGKGYKLTNIKDLKQPGQYACEETLTIKGPKGEFKKMSCKKSVVGTGLLLGQISGFCFFLGFEAV